MTILDTTIDVPLVSSNGKVDIMPKNGAITSKVAFFGMISTLPFKLWIGMSTVLSEMVILVYYKVSEPSKSVEALFNPNTRKFQVS